MRGEIFWVISQQSPEMKRRVDEYKKQERATIRVQSVRILSTPFNPALADEEMAAATDFSPNRGR